MTNEEVTVEIFGKPTPAMLLRALVDDLAEYQTAVEFAWRDASTALGAGELMDVDDLRTVLERICTTTDAAMFKVRHSMEVRRTQADAERVKVSLEKCPCPTNGNGDGSARTCVESGECACTVGEEFTEAAHHDGGKRSDD